MVRFTSRDVLLRVALLLTLSAFYAAPRRFLLFAEDATASSARETRLWLALLVTVVALVGVISTPLVLALHVAQHLLNVRLCTGVLPGDCWREEGLGACVYEYACILSFVAMLRYVLLPPPSILSTTRRHSRQLKRFFQQHDRKYVALVDRLLDDYTGNERLLFARIRKIYRTKSLSPNDMR